MYVIGAIAVEVAREAVITHRCPVDLETRELIDAFPLIA